MLDGQTKDILNIYRLEHLALQLKLPLGEIQHVASNIKSHFWKENKEIYKDGVLRKVRKIYHPSKQLGKILISIDRKLLKQIHLPNSMHGAIRDRSHVTNAKIHLRQCFILKLDIADFFPSITPNHVYNVFKDRLKCSAEVAKVLKKLCIADKHVPQGFNTSPSIANLVLVPAAERLESLCSRLGFKLSIQVDDITISGFTNPQRHLNKFERIINDCGFQIKAEKLTCATNKEQQKVTGIIVNKKLNIDKTVFKDLRAKIIICKKYGPEGLLQDHKITTNKGELITSPLRLRSHLLGKLNYLKQINNKKALPLMDEFIRIQWETP